MAQHQVQRREAEEERQQLVRLLMLATTSVWMGWAAKQHREGGYEPRRRRANGPRRTRATPGKRSRNKYSKATDSANSTTLTA